MNKLLAKNFNYLRQPISTVSVAIVFLCACFPSYGEINTPSTTSPSLSQFNQLNHYTAAEKRQLADANDLLASAKLIVMEDPIEAEKRVQSAYSDAISLNDIDLQAKCLHFLAKLSRSQEDFYLVQVYLRKAEPLLNKLKDQRFKFTLLMLLADLKARFDQEKESLSFVNQAINIASEQKEPQWLFDSYYEKAQLLKSTKHYNESLKSYLLADSHSETLDNATKLRAMDKIAAIYKYLGKHDERISVLVKAIIFLKKTQNEKDLPQFLVNLAQAQRQKNNYAEAINNARKALKIATKHNNLLFKAKASVALSRNYRRLGDFSEALKYSVLSVEVNEEIGNLNGYASALNATGLIHRNLNQNEQGAEYFQKVLALPAQKIKPKYIAVALRETGRYYYQINEYEKGLALSKQSYELFSRLKDKKGAASVRKAIGRLYQSMGQTQKALEAFNDAIADSQLLGDQWSVTSNMINKSKLLIPIDIKQAKEVALQAAKLSHEVGSKSLIINAYNALIIIGNINNAPKDVAVYTEIKKNAEAEINISKLKKQKQNAIELRKVINN